MSKAFPIKPEYRPVVDALASFFAKEPTAKYEEPGKPTEFYANVYCNELSGLVGLLKQLCRLAENRGMREKISSSFHYWSVKRIVAAWFFAWMSMDGGSERMRRMSAESLVEWYQRQRIYNENERERRDGNPFQMVYELLQVAELENAVRWGVWAKDFNGEPVANAERKRVDHYKKRLNGIKRRLWKWLDEREEQGTVRDWFIAQAREFVKNPLGKYNFSSYDPDAIKEGFIELAYA